MKEEYLTRQAELISSKQRGVSIVMVGAGAVGSFTALALAKMGFLNQRVIDFDVIDEENMNCQFYREGDIGLPKVIALNMLLKDFIGETVKAENSKIGPTDVVSSDIVISSVDNMEIRKHLFETSTCKYLIDPRMSAEYATLRVVDMSDEEDKADYAKSLFSDEEAVQERCTAKSTIYTVLLLAGQVVKAVKDIATEQSYMKTMDWSIKHNSIIAFSKDGVKL